MNARTLLLLAGSLACAISLYAEDWPQFLGPTRNGVYAGTNLADKWPDEGPKVLWRKPVGEGFSGPVVAAGKLILFSRDKDEESVQAFDPATGKVLWRTAYSTTYVDSFGFDPGPRATPCVEGGNVYTLGADGILQCLALQDGKVMWRVDTRKVYQARKGFFGMASSPLVEGQAVLVNIGGTAGAGIIALDKANGKLLWKASDEEASYSSPVTATIDGTRQALFLTRHSLVGLDPVSGRQLFTHPFGPSERSSVTAASPVVAGDLIFLSGCYGAGASVVQLKAGAPKVLWSDPDVLSNHYATSVHHRGFLYGVNGRTDPGMPPASLCCVDMKTGKLRWQDETIGPATVTLAGETLVILTEKGELLRAPATPEGFRPGSRAQILSVQVRAYPAIADSHLFARSKNELVGVNLAP